MGDPDFLVYLIRLSEAVLQTSLRTITSLGTVSTSGERNLTVDTETLGSSNRTASLSGENGVTSATVRGYQARTTLDVPGSRLTSGSLEASVEVGGGAGVVATSETRVGFNVNVRACKRSTSEKGSSSGSCDYGFDHFRYLVNLLAEWLPADDGSDSTLPTAINNVPQLSGLGQQDLGE